jgi:hypothetical protein
MTPKAKYPTGMSAEIDDSSPVVHLLGLGMDEKTAGEKSRH